MCVQNPFDQKKQFILDEINSVQPDLSPKGTIDELCLPIMDLINAHNDLVTTSSCSGRISVFVEGTKEYNDDLKVGGKGQGGRWLYVSHDSDNVTGWLKKLEDEGHKFIENTEPDVENFDGKIRYVLYKYEPFILHVKCRDFSIASRLYNAAMSCGFRESGIGSNNIVAIRINIKLDVPIGFLDEKTDELHLFVSRKYITLLDKLTLTKFEDNKRKMQELYNRVKKDVIDLSIVNNSSTRQETKEERRERKKAEGLKKQREQQEAKLKELDLE